MMEQSILIQDCVCYLDTILESNRFSDFCPNGLQVQGQAKVSKFVSGVSASMKLFEHAYEAQAQMILVHHGILWGKKVPCVVGNLKQRLEYLLEKKLSLVAYHLPLDAHLDIGNNIQIARQLDCKFHQSFATYANQPIGLIATPENHSISFQQLKNRVNQHYDNTFILDFGPSKIHKIAIVSGAGAPYLEEAIQNGCHALITGEVKESTIYLAQEAGIHVIGLGHYQSEKGGIQALACKLSQQFNLQHEFIDIPNPL